MAGSYLHAVNETGQLRNVAHMSIPCENDGDSFETLEEMYGMIWFLAHGSAAQVEYARQNYQAGITMSPGIEPEDREYPDEYEQDGEPE